MKKQAWTAILLWMALFSFTLSAQGTGGTTTDLTVTTDGGTPETRISESYPITTAGTYHFTGTYSGEPTAEIGSSKGTAVISVAAGIAGEVTIILEDVNITLSGDKECPLSARNATGTVIVQLKGENKLTSGAQCPALWAPQTSEGKLIINSSGTGSEVGSLTATGGDNAAGIGGGYGGAGGTITIKGGTVLEAKGGNQAAGIGGGYGGAGGTITISGANTNVTATGGYGGAGIGGGSGGAGGTITIEEGKVQATGGNWGAGIGGGFWGDAGTIIITGGEVTAKGGYDTAAGIGYGKNYTGTDGTITITGGTVTATNGSNPATDIPDIKGNTVIVGPDATVKKDENGTDPVYNNDANGFVFEENATSAEMKGTATLSADITIGNGQTLTIQENASLTIEENVTLTNKGTIYKRGAINGTKFVSNVESGKIIIQTKLTEEMITVAPCTYTGSALTPNVTVSYSSTTYEKDTDYTLTCANNTNAAEPTAANPPTVTVTPTQTGRLYGNPVVQEFTINKATTTIAEFTASGKIYDGNPIDITAPEVTGGTLSNQKAALSYFQDETPLESAPVDAGSYTVKASYPGNNNHKEAEKTADFQITKADNGWTTSLSNVETPWTYGKNGNYPTAVAKFGEVEYKYYSKEEGSDQYTPLETKPLNAGTWYVTAKVTGTNNYTELSESNYASFTITAKALTEEMVTLSPTEYTYDGNQPTIMVNDGEATLVENTDYMVTWPDDPTGVGTHTVTITGKGNFKGSIAKSYTINARPYIPPTPDPDPIYYTVTIPTEVAGAIIHGGGTHEVEEYTYCSFRIELDPNGNGEYPTVTKGYWWDTLTPDGQGNYSVYVTGNTQITIGEVPTNSYDYYQVTLPTDSVAEADDQYWSGDYIEVTGASPLRAAEEASLSYQAPFGMTVTLRPIETERRKFLQWEDGSKQKERTLTLRADQEVKALWQRISPTGIEAIAAGSVIRGERGQLYIEVPEACDVTLYTYGGVPVRVARLAAGANRLANLNAGLYLVKIGAAPAVPVRIR